MTVITYGAGRGGGKTTWLREQIDAAVRQGLRVALVAPTHRHEMQPSRILSAHETAPDTYSETTFFPRGRGRIYDHIFVDNADLFEHDPAELCAQVAPGVPVTMTYTPHDGSSLPTRANLQGSLDSEPTLSKQEQEYLALLLAVRFGWSLRTIMESGIAQSAAAAGLLWKMTHDG